MQHKLQHNQKILFFSLIHYIQWVNVSIPSQTHLLTYRQTKQTRQKTNNNVDNVFQVGNETQKIYFSYKKDLYVCWSSSSYVMAMLPLSETASMYLHLYFERVTANGDNTPNSVSHSLTLMEHPAIKFGQKTKQTTLWYLTTIPSQSYIWQYAKKTIKTQTASLWNWAEALSHFKSL